MSTETATNDAWFSQCLMGFCQPCIGDDDGSTEDEEGQVEKIDRGEIHKETASTDDEEEDAFDGKENVICDDTNSMAFHSTVSDLFYDASSQLKMTKSTITAPKNSAPLSEISEVAVATAPSEVPVDVPSISIVRTVDTKLNLTTREVSDIAKLFKHCPDSTEEERVRFLRAKKGHFKAALEQLQGYMDFRRKYNLDEEETTTTKLGTAPSNVSAKTADEEWHSCSSSFIGDEDEDDWNIASAVALSFAEEENLPRHPNGNLMTLPRLARVDFSGNQKGEPLFGKDGNKIIQVVPAKLDIKLASEKTYALCLSIYLTKKVSRTSMEQVIVCLDARPGHPWPNPPAGSILPFIKYSIRLMERNFPERLSKLVLYPLPRTASALWSLIKMFLDPTTAKKIIVVSGAAGRDSPLPSKKIEKYIDKEVLDIMENHRSSENILNEC